MPEHIVTLSHALRPGLNETMENDLVAPGLIDLQRLLSSACICIYSWKLIDSLKSKLLLLTFRLLRTWRDDPLTSFRDNFLHVTDPVLQLLGEAVIEHWASWLAFGVPYLVLQLKARRMNDLHKYHECPWFSQKCFKRRTLKICSKKLQYERPWRLKAASRCLPPYLLEQHPLHKRTCRPLTVPTCSNNNGFIGFTDW